MNIVEGVIIVYLNPAHRFLSNQRMGFPEGITITIRQTGNMKTLDKKGKPARTDDKGMVCPSQKRSRIRKRSKYDLGRGETVSGISVRVESAGFTDHQFGLDQDVMAQSPGFGILEFVDQYLSTGHAHVVLVLPDGGQFDSDKRCNTDVVKSH